MSSLKKLDTLISQLEKDEKKRTTKGGMKGQKTTGGTIKNFAGGAIRNFAGGKIKNFAGGRRTGGMRLPDKPLPANFWRTHHGAIAGLPTSLMRPIKLLVANELEKKGGAMINRILKGKGLTGGKCKCGKGLTGGRKKCGMGLTGGIRSGGVRSGGRRTGGVQRDIVVGGELLESVGSGLVEGGKKPRQKRVSIKEPKSSKKGKVPPQLKGWHEHVARVRAENPDIPYSEVLKIASDTK